MKLGWKAYCPKCVNEQQKGGRVVRGHFVHEWDFHDGKCLCGERLIEVTDEKVIKAYDELVILGDEYKK